MKVDVILGLQWGDEGKGKIVDVLSPKYDVICRFQGGPNAGHSLQFGNIKHVLHSIPSGVFHDNKINIIGNGVVLDPVAFMKEVKGLEDLGLDLKKKLLISRKAHLILPTHRILDAASEAAKGATKIGSTLRGIGPTYMDKTGRNGLRVGDLQKTDFKDRYRQLVNKHMQLLKMYDYSFTLDSDEQEWFKGIELIKTFQLIDSEIVINKYLDQNKSVLAEGAQGTLLDIDFGSYPFVTSSNTICAGVCTGLGIAPSRIGEVYGVFKAYCTRVGSGPFPTELNDETGKKIREYGNEFGATTGRPRRCGWLDLVALKYSIVINGVTQLIMTKSDVLDAFETIKVATKYKNESGEVENFPYDLEDIKGSVYQEFNGWQKSIKDLKTIKNLPVQLDDYIYFIENQTKVPVKMVSVGPDRDATLFKE